MLTRFPDLFPLRQSRLWLVRLSLPQALGRTHYPCRHIGHGTMRPRPHGLVPRPHCPWVQKRSLHQGQSVLRRSAKMQEPRVEYGPPETLQKPLDVPEKLLLGPGPSNPHPRVLQSQAKPLLGHLHPEFLAIMDEIKAGLQYVFQTTNSLTIALTGSGHAGMEASLVNVVEPGDTVLILKNGIWGVRAQDMAERCGANALALEHPPGEVFTLEQVAQGLEKYSPSVLFVCQGESSNGTCQSLEGMGELCQKHNCLLLVDTVAALGGTPFYMDKWGVDIVYSGSQKVLGAPPGTAPISFGPRARAKIASRKTKIQSFYFDINWLAQYWGIDNSPRVYHHTASISSYYALREGLAMLAEEGLEACWKRHKENSELLWSGLEKMGLEMFIPDKSLRLPTVNTIKVPSGIDPKELSAYIMDKYKIEVSGGLGPTAGKVWRIGLMGYNSSAENVQRVLEAMEDALQHCRNQTKTSA